MVTGQSVGYELVEKAANVVGFPLCDFGIVCGGSSSVEMWLWWNW